MANFPTSLDTTTTIPQPTSGQNTNSPGHAELHTAESQAIIAIETKLGIGSAVPANNLVLRGNGAGASTWDQVHLATDVSGQLPVANGGTGTNISTGSGAVVLQTSPTLTSPTVSGGLTVDNITMSGAINGFNPSTGWSSLANTYTYGANNGNKEFTATVPVDLRTIITPGMRFQATRGTAPPTQCMAFASASNQSAANSNPSGLSFTGNFTIEAWVYPLSYGLGAIISHDSAGGTLSGWELAFEATGQPSLFWRNASGVSQFTAYQSLPLNRWTHVAVVATVATPIAQFYLNGVAVPTQTVATAATSVVQPTSTAVTLGKENSAANYFNGYLSEVRVWNAAISLANIQARMATNCAGNETNLVACYKGNGAWTDATSNANTLTPAGGASDTQANNPFNSVEYFIITKISYSAPNTTLTLFGGTDYTLPNMTLTSPMFSREKNPFGFPSSRFKWLVDFILKAQYSTAGTSGVWANVGNQISLPTGDWDVRYSYFGLITHSGATFLNAVYTLSTANNSETDNRFTMQTPNISVSLTQQAGLVAARAFLSLLSQTIYYLNGKPSASSTNLYFDGSADAATIVAESAYV